MHDSFSEYHPVINFIYFVFVIGVSMFFTHPVILITGLLAAICYSFMLAGVKKTAKGFFIFTLPMMIIVALLNPMFNHYGVTVLFYLENGNAVTLESMVYGMAMAVMLCQVVTWFSCLNKVMTSDKFMYIFGRVIPAISLVISMCMRFIPRFKQRTKIIRNGQKCIGQDISSGGVGRIVRNGITTLSILITWSLENAIDTADSMRSRGYGLRGRTSFSNYSFKRRDYTILCIMACFILCFNFGVICGYTKARFNPRIVMGGMPFTLGSVICFASYFMFCLMPVAVNLISSWKWKRFRGNMEIAEGSDYRLWTL